MGDWVRGAGRVARWETGWEGLGGGWMGNRVGGAGREAEGETGWAGLDRRLGGWLDERQHYPPNDVTSIAGDSFRNGQFCNYMYTSTKYHTPPGLMICVLRLLQQSGFCLADKAKQLICLFHDTMSPILSLNADISAIHGATELQHLDAYSSSLVVIEHR